MNCNQDAGGVLPEKNRNNQEQFFERYLYIWERVISLSKYIFKTESALTDVPV